MTSYKNGQFEELRELYMKLYNDENAFNYFVTVLEKNAAERPLALKQRDREFEAGEGWKSEPAPLGMMIYTENFGGTLAGVRERLPYIKECGVNYLHLMPLLDSPHGRSDGGYAVSDFRKVRPDLGTMEDLEELTAACHDNGIAVCFDFVLNHVSEEHAWAVSARAGDPASQARFFMYDNWDVPNLYEGTVPQVFPATAPGNFSWCGECGKVVMTTFHPYQWDLNYANPMVFNDMTDNLLYLANRGIDVVRLDAIPYIWKALWTSCRNLPEVHTIVRMMNLACSIVCPGVQLLGEVVMEPKEVVPYFGPQGRPECDMLYNVTMMCTLWHTVATRDVRLLRHQMEQLYQLPGEYTFQNYLRCHDDIGWGLDYGFLGGFGYGEVPHKKYLNDWFTGKWPGSKSRGELYNDFELLGDARLCGTTASLCGIEAALYEGGRLRGGSSEAADASYRLSLAVRCDIMLHAFTLFQRGVPVLYSGDEVGQLNDYTYHDDPDKRDDSRYLHRGKFDLALAAERTEKGTVPEAIYSALSSMQAARAKYRVLGDEAGLSLTASDAVRADNGCGAHDSVITVTRTLDGDRLTGIFNFSDADLVVYAGGGSCLEDILTGERFKASRADDGPDGAGLPDPDEDDEDIRIPVRLEGYGFRWLLSIAETE